MSKDDPLITLYGKMFKDMVLDDQIEAAHWFWSTTVDKNPQYWRDKRYTNLPISKELTLIKAYRDLIEMGCHKLAKQIRIEILENPKYRQLDLLANIKSP